MLKAENLTVGYGSPVVSGFDYTFALKRTTAVIGKNGCGKTTLLRTLAGRQKPLSGGVRLNGEDIFSLPPKGLARKVAYLPQVRDVPDIEAAALVSHGRFPHLGFPRILRPDDKAAVEQAMRLTDTLKFYGRNVKSLSGGERQRVYLAMTLATGADILLLDEPTTYLDVRDACQTLELIRSLPAAAVVVLHDLGCALRYCDDVCLICGGKLLASGSAADVFDSGQIQSTFGIKGARVDEGEAAHYVFYL